MKSGFNKNLVRDMINISKELKDRFRPPVQKCSDKQKQKTVWPTSFPKFLKLTTKERQLNENAMVTYRRPQTLSQSLTKYRKIAHDVEEECAGEGAGWAGREDAGL